MNRFAASALVVLVAALSACASEPAITVEEYDAAVAVGPFEDWPRASLDRIGEGACDQMREYGDAGLVGSQDALIEGGMTEKQAARAAAAFVARFCPDLAG